MKKYDLSVLICGRNEQFYSITVENILKNIRGNTEIICTFDTTWAVPGLPDDPRVTIIYSPNPLGQRAATNYACRLSNAKYVMKIDSHCIVDEGFDVKMMDEMHDDWTMIPKMYNLHAFNWKCESCGNTLYQGPTPKEGCPSCHKPMIKEMKFQRRDNTRNMFYRFDPDLHFQYHPERKQHPDAQGNIAETMSAQGSCFMMTREKYWELNICDEKHGNWGQQGVEVACKTWLSGGRLVTNKKTWYAHMFRTQGGDFGFPWPWSGKQVAHAKNYSKKLWMENTYEKQIYPLSWLIEKFRPLPDWHIITPKFSEEVVKATLEKVNAAGEEFYRVKGRKNPFTEKKLTKGILYYTDNKLDLHIAHAVQRNLSKIGLPIFSSSLKPMSFGKNVFMDKKRGYLTMAEQILKGLESMDTEVVFFCEHDVIYDKSHFYFDPEKKDVFYYNENVWKVRASDGHGVHYNNCRQLSGLCCYRKLAIAHFEKRVNLLRAAKNHSTDEEFSRYVRSMGFEPGTHRRPERVDSYTSESWQSPFPNIDIRHDRNLTPSRWSPDEFRNKKYADGWIESDKIEGWGIITDVLKNLQIGGKL